MCKGDGEIPESGYGFHFVSSKFDVVVCGWGDLAGVARWEKQGRVKGKKSGHGLITTIPGDLTWFCCRRAKQARGEKSARLSSY